jgi:S-(hydroxymethyl)glutathione dehydrogenase/alcohol dehydrogenase
MRAAVLFEQGKPQRVEDVALEAPRTGEVSVRMVASGVCHSCLHAADGSWKGVPLPIVLGDEGAGVVETLGPGVTELAVGDHVVLSWAPACGECPSCREGRAVLCDRVEKVTFRNKLPGGGARLHARDRDVAPFLGTACFADAAVVPESAVIPVPTDVPFEALATLGCAVVTGVGAVINAAHVPAGSRVVVIGAGGVGLNVVQGAVVAGCDAIIAVDLRPVPLTIARQFGATDTIDAAGDVPARVRELTGGRGADFVFDTVGNPATLTTALAATKKGGTVVLTGLSRVDAQGAVAMFPFVMQEKRLIGSVYGSGQPRQDIRQLVSLYQDGRLKLRELVARTYTLDRINDALTALAASDGARGVVTW